MLELLFAIAFSGLSYLFGMMALNLLVTVIVLAVLAITWPFRAIYRALTAERA